MCNLPNMTKADLAELSQRRKKKLKKNNVKTDERVALEWICIDSTAQKPMIKQL